MDIGSVSSSGEMDGVPPNISLTLCWIPGTPFKCGPPFQQMARKALRGRFPIQRISSCQRSSAFYISPEPLHNTTLILKKMRDNQPLSLRTGNPWRHRGRERELPQLLHAMLLRQVDRGNPPKSITNNIKRVIQTIVILPSARQGEKISLHNQQEEKGIPYNFTLALCSEHLDRALLCREGELTAGVDLMMMERGLVEMISKALQGYGLPEGLASTSMQGLGWSKGGAWTIWRGEMQPG